MLPGFRIFAGPSRDERDNCHNVLVDAEIKARRVGSSARRNFVPLGESQENIQPDALLLFPYQNGSLKAGKIIGVKESDKKLIIHYQKPRHARKENGERCLTVEIDEFGPETEFGQSTSILIANYGTMRESLRTDIWWLMTWDKKFKKKT
jgi:hypothetical protein